MKFGICLECNGELDAFIAQVKQVEDLGYEYLWLTDLGLKAMDVISFMTVAAVHSKRLLIGAGVHPPQLRHPAVTLNALATIDRMSGGRITFGFGMGDAALLAPIGHRPLKMTSARELVDLSRRLMAGETVDSQTPELVMNKAALAYPPAAPMPIYIAATGPRTLALAAELVDGVFAHVGASVATIQDAMASCAAGVAARKLPQPYTFMPFLYASIAEQRTDAIATCARGAKTVAMRAPHLARIAGCTSEQEQRLRQGADGADDIFTEQFISELTISGTAGDCIAKLEAIAGVGVEHVALYPKGSDISAQIEVFGRHVLPHF